jgi:hypothetical protein
VVVVVYSEARILGSHETKIIPLRKVGARHIGSLVRIRGMVTRTTEVKPLMIVAAYTCSDCETAIYQEVLGKTFMPIIQCPSAECQKKQTKGRLHPHMRASKFTKFQEVRIQEVRRLPRYQACLAVISHYSSPSVITARLHHRLPKRCPWATYPPVLSSTREGRRHASVDLETSSRFGASFFLPPLRVRCCGSPSSCGATSQW